MGFKTGWKRDYPRLGRRLGFLAHFWPISGRCTSIGERAWTEALFDVAQGPQVLGPPTRNA